MIVRIVWIILLFLHAYAVAQDKLQWPGNNEVAVSLSFDDARESQVLQGTSLLDSFGVKATFYVVPSAVKRQWEGWKRAVAGGHEIGNHTLTHPCTGNFAWSRKNALEEYDLEKMQNELKECNRQVKDLLNVDCKVFAYPCGQKFVGKGTDTKSYVPLIASLFTSGRGWMDEAPNDPAYLNKDQLTCIESDGKTFEQLLGVINEARKTGSWVIFGGHEINEGGSQTTLISSLRRLLTYVKDPANGIWIAPVGMVAEYIDAFQKNRN
jgi:peptidoglycan/xylan/chitin deacetylase (PgdA/CDA1 family)